MIKKTIDYLFKEGPCIHSRQEQLVSVYHNTEGTQKDFALVCQDCDKFIKKLDSYTEKGHWSDYQGSFRRNKHLPIIK